MTSTIRFSPRQKQVVLLFGDGLTIDQIGARLQIDPTTCRVYLRAAFEKLRSKIEAPELTKRERECLELYAGGLKVKGIARKLGLGIRTIDTHLQKVRDKTGIHNAAGLGAAWQRGLAAPKRGESVQEMVILG